MPVGNGAAYQRSRSPKPITREQLEKLYPKTAEPSIRFHHDRLGWLTVEQWYGSLAITDLVSDPYYFRRRAEEAERLAAGDMSDEEREKANRPKARKKSVAEEEVMLGDNSFQTALKPISKAEVRRRKKAEEREKMLRAAGQTTLAA